jgi:hypothetical protein
MSSNKKRFYFRFFQVGFSAFFQNEKNLFWFRISINLIHKHSHPLVHLCICTHPYQ